MSLFNLDKVIPYDMYLRWIYDHAVQFQPTPVEPPKLARTVEVLLSVAEQSLRDGHADMAYFHTVKSLQFFDKSKTGVDLRTWVPSSSRLMSRALEFAERLKAKELRQYYEAMVRRIQSREPERMRIISQQLAVDEGNGVNVPADRQSQHDMRRQQLLMQEAAVTSQLANNLNRLAIASPQQQAAATPGVYTVTEIERRQAANDVYGAATTLSPGSMTPMSVTPLNQQLTPQESPSSMTNTNVQVVETATAYVPPRSPGQESYSAGVTPRSPRSLSPRRFEAWAFNEQPGVMTFVRRGIVNLGNTCYMNSVLQMLNSTAIADFFHQSNFTSAMYNPKTYLAECYHHLICDLRSPNAAYSVSPSAFKAAMARTASQFDNSSQQDANEFLRVLLDGLHSSLNASAANRNVAGEVDNVHGSDDEIAARYWHQYLEKNSSVIVDMCAFQERSMLRCPACQQSSRSFAPTFGIELPIPHPHHHHFGLGNSRVSIEDCLVAYCKEEVLDSNSLYLCPGCKRKVNATKQMSFYTLPDILFVTLKRFMVYGDFTNASKNNTKVYFQRTLDFAPYLCTPRNNTRYRLIAIANHQGNMYGGHYTADCVAADNMWCHFSDETVNVADKPDYALAYILCYQRL